MEFSDLIESRRSIRDYKKSEATSKEDIEKIIYAAQQAPSWKNSQTGRYYAVISKENITKVQSFCLPGFNAERTQNASAYIVTAFKKGISGFGAEGTQVDELGNSWGAYDLGLQNENLILKARELGYDTLIMGLKNNNALREMLQIPIDEEIMAIIALGKRNSEPTKPLRKDISEILKFF
jgi:nitroreductase